VIDIPKGRYVTARSINIVSWCPTPQPTVPPTQVHMLISVADDVTIVMRFKGPATLDTVIAALQSHRREVWDEQPACGALNPADERDVCSKVTEHDGEHEGGGGSRW
jgi:hypothetical protein